MNAIELTIEREKLRNSTGPWICSGCTHTEHTALTEQFWKMLNVPRRKNLDEKTSIINSKTLDSNNLHI